MGSLGTPLPSANNNRIADVNRLLLKERPDQRPVALFDPVSRLAIQGQIGPFRTQASYVLTPVVGGTRLTNEVDLEPSSGVLRVLAPLAVPRVKAAVAENLGKLKQVLEGGGHMTSEMGIPPKVGSGVPVPEPGALPDVLDRPPGYHKLHPDVSVNFQLNRWLSWMTPQALQDVAAIALHIHGYADFTSAFLELGDRLLAEGRRLDAASCYRAPEFFLVPGDERKAPARRRFLELIREVYQVGPPAHGLPYEGGSLPAYRFGAPRKGTVVLFGGFDSYVEEFFPMMLGRARVRAAPRGRLPRARAPTGRGAARVSIKVLVADDQALVRTGFRMILEAEPGIEVPPIRCPWGYTQRRERQAGLRDRLRHGRHVARLAPGHARARSAVLA